MSMLVSDYDGTFYSNNKDIDINCAAIRRYIAEGNTFVLSSGRSYTSLMKQVSHYDIPYSFLSTADGSYLFDNNGNLLLAHRMPHDIIKKVKGLENLSGCKRVDYTYEREYDAIYRNDEDLSSISFVINNSNITQPFIDEFSRLKMDHPDYDYCIYSYNGESYYMIKSKGVSKSNPIIFLRDSLMIPQNDIFTVGDNLNDLEMIRDFNGFMVGDNPILKQIALKKYCSVNDLVSDIVNKKVKRR